MFAGSEHNPHTDTTCALVALALAEQNIGKVLLVDSNSAGELSAKRDLEGQAGLSEIVNEGADWPELITNQSAAALDFLPVGTAVWEQWGGAQRLSLAAAEMKREYQFICVSAGDAHEQGARLWSGICDGSYLLVSLKNSNQTIAESAVTELQVSGARLLGCVATDV
jgi:Mrp family chromosome partitioning ATPase